MSSVPDRGEVDEQYKWDLASVYEGDDEWEAAFDEVEDRVEELAALEGETTESGAKLLETLETYEDVMREVEMVFAYARMKRDQDTRDQDAQAMASRARSLYAQAQSAASFIEPELQDLSREALDALVEAEPALERYDHYFDDVLRQAEHTRSAEVENLLAELSEVTGSPGEIYSMLSDADVEFPTVETPDGDDVEITNANFTNLLKRRDREFRETVYENYFETWADLRNTVATAYEKSVTADVTLAQARDHDTAREAALHGPNIPVEVYDTLLESVRGNLDKLHRHAELKQEALGVDELRMWDLYMPLASGESPTVEYEQAREYVVDALGALGEDYQQRVADGLDSRWVDVYENEGKRSGAYSGGTYDTQPFILMNYQDDVSSMYTLAPSWATRCTASSPARTSRTCTATTRYSSPRSPPPSTRRC